MSGLQGTQEKPVLSPRTLLAGGTLTVLRVNLLLLSLIAVFNRAVRPSFSASLFVTTKSSAHDGTPLPGRPRIASPSSTAPRAPGLWWLPESTRTHKPLGLPRMCISHPHPCFVLPFAFSFVHHPPLTAAYVLLWCSGAPLRIHMFLPQCACVRISLKMFRRSLMGGCTVCKKPKRNQ